MCVSDFPPSLAEVARTRLREGNPRYHKFWQTIMLVYREEGRRGLYRGMVTQLCRQIPNTAIMMVTYEFVVYGLSRKANENDSARRALNNDPFNLMSTNI